jgi:hypothetical protein
LQKSINQRRLTVQNGISSSVPNGFFADILDPVRSAAFLSSRRFGFSRGGSFARSSDFAPQSTRSAIEELEEQR